MSVKSLRSILRLGSRHQFQRAFRRLRPTHQVLQDTPPDNRDFVPLATHTHVHVSKRGGQTILTDETQKEGVYAKGEKRGRLEEGCMQQLSTRKVTTQDADEKEINSHSVLQ